MILYTAKSIWLTSFLTAAIPPNIVVLVVAAVGKELTPPCPLQFMESFGQFYSLEWRINNMTVARTSPPDSTSCACLNGLTLDTLDLVIFSLPKYECMTLTVKQQEELSFGNTAKGNVNINLPCKSCTVRNPSA